MVGIPVTFKKIEAAAPAPAVQAPPASPQAADPAPSSAAQTPAPAAPAQQDAAPAAYPPLALDSSGKPKAAAHRVRLENGAVELALQVLAPGKTIESLRIDNVGGVQSLWRSDGKDGAAPLSVSHDGKNIGSGTQMLNLAAGDKELLLSLSLKDNGAFAGKDTDFRVAVFFADGERAMCVLKKN